MENKWNNETVIKVLRQIIIDRLEAVGKFVEDNANLLVPVDSGYLRGSITHKVDEQDLSVIIGTNVEYAAYVEFGTGEYAENGQGRKGGWFYVTDKPVVAGWLKALGKLKDGKYLYFTYGSKPQPYLRPAILENKDEIRRILTE